MKTIIAIILMIASWDCYAFDFKGVEVGKQSSYEAVGNTLIIQCHDAEDQTIWCNGTVTILGNDAAAFVNLNKDKIVESISVEFNPDSFEDIAESLTSKYGTPKSIKKSILQNGLGVEFNQVKMMWKKDSNVLYLDKYAGKVSEGRLWMVTKSHLIDLGKAVEKRKSDI